MRHLKNITLKRRDISGIFPETDVLQDFYSLSRSGSLNQLTLVSMPTSSSLPWDGDRCRRDFAGIDSEGDE